MMKVVVVVDDDDGDDDHDHDHEMYVIWGIVGQNNNTGIQRGFDRHMLGQIWCSTSGFGIHHIFKPIPGSVSVMEIHNIHILCLTHVDCI